MIDLKKLKTFIMEQIKVGDSYDIAFNQMQTREIQDNLEAVAYGVQETSYTKNLTEEEVIESQFEERINQEVEKIKDFVTVIEF